MLQVAEPCIPCEGLCVEEICNDTCKPNEVQLIKIVLDNLDLVNASIYDTEFNITTLVKHFLTVKAVTGKSRKSAIRWSENTHSLDDDIVIGVV